MAIKKPQKLFSYREQQYLDKDIAQIYGWLSKVELVDTTPNTNKLGKRGELVLFNNAGTYELWANTGAGENKTWQKIPP